MVIVDAVVLSMSSHIIAFVVVVVHVGVADVPASSQRGEVHFNYIILYILKHMYFMKQK